VDSTRGEIARERKKFWHFNLAGTSAADRGLFATVGCIQRIAAHRWGGDNNRILNIGHQGALLPLGSMRTPSA
jgi:hypothetical protein